MTPGKLAWRQLTADRRRLAAAIAGVAFAVLLMLMQLGFRAAMLQSAVRYQQQLVYDLVLLSPKSVFIGIMHPFPRRRLYQALAEPGVEWVSPLYAWQQHWKNPWRHNTRNLLVVGVDPARVVLDAPGVAAGQPWLRERDTVLFDARSRPEFGPVAEHLRHGESVEAEIGVVRVRIAGLFALGSSFGVDGNVLTSDETFRRIFPDRTVGAIDIGLVKLARGVSLAAAQQSLQQRLGPEVEVLTREDYVRRELAYWEGTTPIGYVFGFGLVMGLVVGGIIVYQILFADVSDHLHEYATLKAVGYSDRFLGGVVLREAVFLALLGFLPGVLLTLLCYEVAGLALRMPITLTAGRSGAVLLLTVAMCAAAGRLALRRLRAADPAEVF